DERGRDRKEQHSAEYTLPSRGARIDEQRRRERDEDRERPADQREVRRVAQCLPEQRIGQKVTVVVERDEAQVVEVRDRVDVEVGKAQSDGRHDRDDEEREYHRESRSDEAERSAR